ncbi:hypothetical protein LDENG_00179270 [Lucifuga dentata]|nr:hypothetical protein LDENG_00179270 [Lucifuga dentata]
MIISTIRTIINKAGDVKGPCHPFFMFEPHIFSFHTLFKGPYHPFCRSSFGTIFPGGGIHSLHTFY